jgi:hypothetical protein
VKFGVVGTNLITVRTLNEARRIGDFSLTAVCSRSKERAEQFAHEQGIAFAFDSLDALAACEIYDAANAIELFMRLERSPDRGLPYRSITLDTMRVMDESRRQQGLAYDWNSVMVKEKGVVAL